MPATPKLSITRSISQGDLNPVGMIVQSVLTEVQFQALNGTSWVLMDGRSVAGSTYATVTGSSTIPDARGMVLRGKNNGRSDGNQDPGGERALGNFQDDSMQGHHHSKSETPHGHGVSDSGHSHGITDPGHTHTVAVGGATNAASSNARTEVGGNLRTTSSSATGISVNGSLAGIGVQGADSNVSITNPSNDGVNGSPRTSVETRMRNITVNHFIKID